MNDDFDFGAPPETGVAELQKEVTELKVLIDTLQANLRSAESIIKKYDPECQLFNIPSYKWCMRTDLNK